MARRKEFKTIADGLIGNFVSRNNDVSGYWGIGKLYSHMVFSGSMKIKIDLIKEQIEPYDDELKILVSRFANKLKEKVVKRRIKESYLKSAELILNGFKDDKSPYFGRIAPNRINCKLIIIDDLSNEYFSEANVWCREHDPKREFKSLRN